MGRTRSPEIVKRNDKMYAAWQRGASITAVAAENGIARQVAARIIASYHPEEEEDTDRSVFRGELWRLYDEVGDLYQNPGYKMSPAGGAATGPDGEPAPDTNVQVQAGELRLKVLRELRILDARDRPAQQNIKHSHEHWVQQKDDDLARRRAEMEAKLEAARLGDAERRELETLRRQVGNVIPGEVEREEVTQPHR